MKRYNSIYIPKRAMQSEMYLKLLEIQLEDLNKLKEGLKNENNEQEKM